MAFKLNPGDKQKDTLGSFSENSTKTINKLQQNFTFKSDLAELLQKQKTADSSRAIKRGDQFASKLYDFNIIKTKNGAGIVGNFGPGDEGTFIATSTGHTRGAEKLEETANKDFSQGRRTDKQRGVYKKYQRLLTGKQKFDN